MSLVLLHGFVGAPDDFRLVLGHLAPSLERRALALPGHAPSEPVDVALDFEGVADRLLERAMPSTPLSLVGYSLGARLALSIALRHPSRVAGVTLIGVHPGLEDTTESAARAQSDAAWADLLERDGLAPFLERWHAQEVLRTREPRPDRSHHDARQLALALRQLGLAQMPSYWSRLPQLTLPVRLIVGADDAKFAPIAERMRTLLPHANLVRVPDAGHNVVVDQPEALARALVVNTSP